MEFEDQIELLKEYLQDANEFLDRYEAQLLELEGMAGGEADPELLRDILSSLHTFKGNSGMMGFSNLQKFTHRLEDVFKAIQSGKLHLTADLAGSLMNTLNAMRDTVGGLEGEKPVERSLDAELVGLDILLEKGSELDAAAHKAQAQAAGAMKEKDIKTFFKKTNTLKVDFERLDNLMNLMGELVIHRTRLGRIDAQIKDIVGERGLTLDLTDTTEQIGKITTELHEAIMRVRMMPIKQVFLRFPKLARDLSKDTGKEINLMFEGEDTELDKTVIDEIGEPLIHLVRNAIDHGIEKPAERIAVGKNPQGTVFLKAYQESNHIIITIEDDGRGIDESKLRKKAKEMGIAEGDDLDRLSLVEMIFMQGLSTAEKVTEVSGRGIGMDVVKKSLGKINGNIEVSSEPGMGCKFTIKLPLTLAIISALMVKVGVEQYAVPLASVVESIKMENEDVHMVNGREVTRIRDKYLPLFHLSDLFTVGANGNGNGHSKYAVIVQSALGRIGLMVDTLLGQQEVVIKALDDYFGDAAGIAGATILGDGKVVLIVDVLELMSRIKRSSKQGFHVEARNGK